MWMYKKKYMKKKNAGTFTFWEYKIGGLFSLSVCVSACVFCVEPKADFYAMEYELYFWLLRKTHFYVVIQRFDKNTF